MLLKLEMKNWTKISALSSGKIDKYETLLSDQRRLIEQDKFTYSSLEKAFKKQKK